jgi:hypothetical protein
MVRSISSLHLPSRKISALAATSVGVIVRIHHQPRRFCASGRHGTFEGGSDAGRLYVVNQDRELHAIRSASDKTVKTDSMIRSMTRDSNYSPFAPFPSARAAEPGELLFEFYVARTHAFYRVELREHGPAYGVEVQFLDPINLLIARTFRSSDDPTGVQTPREMAIAWAIAERNAIEQGGV